MVSGEGGDNPPIPLSAELCAPDPAKREAW